MDATQQQGKKTPAQLSFQQGRAERAKGNLPAAIACFEETIRLQADYYPAYNNLANLLQTQGQNDAAVALYEKALTFAPNKAVLHCNLASLRQIRGEAELALAGFEQALRIDPNFFLAHHNLGRLHVSQRRLDQAAAAFTHALRLKPDNGEVHLDLGHVYRQQDRFDQAVACYKAAIRCAPKSAQAYNCLGAMLQQRGEMKYSLACHRRALKLDPNLDVAHFNIAMLLETQGQMLEAQAHYEKSLALQPQALNVLYHLTHLRLKLADWQDHEQRLDELVAMTQTHLQEDRQVSLPLFSLLALPLPDALLASVTRQLAKMHKLAAEALQANLPAPPAVQARPERLRVGYVSPDFRGHAVGTLIAKIFQHHTRPDFEIFAYSLAPIVDEWTEAIRAGCDHYLDVSSLSPLDIAKRIRADGIHMLIDLAGYTSNSKTTVFALKPAPVQLQYLGYPGSMGADFIGHVLADQWLIPPEVAEHYSEQVIRLPHGWVASAMQVADSTPTRAECALPEQGTVFCCFNGAYKIEPGVFALWMRILHRVPGSVLWLAEGAHPIVAQRLRAQAELAKIDPSRLVFAKNLPHDQYLARYRLADLFLDALAYNAGATAAGALSAGLPVLTCPGKRYVSRMGASLCQGVGMPEMICTSEQDYEERAVALGNDPAQMQALKAKLAKAHGTAPLFQPKLFVRELEQALRGVWQSHIAGQG